MDDDSSPTTSAPDLLAKLLGEWTGTYRLWLEPGVLRTECPTHLVARSVVGGRFVALDYDWTELDGPQLGSMLLGCSDAGTWELAWVDTWHTQSAIMFSTGDAPIEVLGSYGPKGDEWGWRTQIDLEPSGGLVITAWNVTPVGDSAKATEARYERVGELPS